MVAEQLLNNILEQFFNNKIFLLGLILVGVVTLLKNLPKKRKKTHRHIELNTSEVKISATETQSFPLSSLNIIANAEFSKRALMNKSEYYLFIRLTSLLEKFHIDQRYRLFSQVAMGEFIQSHTNDAFRLINNKRVDFLIIDRLGNPVIAIEYQGSGHYQNNAIERDAIKKEACRKAGIEYIEFPKEYDQLHFERISQILNVEFNKQREKNANYQLAKNQ